MSNSADYFRVKRAEKNEPLIAKVPCKHCGYYNNPLRLFKRNKDKYYRCLQCGKELKTDKEDFRDKLIDKMKEVNK